MNPTPQTKSRTSAAFFHKRTGPFSPLASRPNEAALWNNFDIAWHRRQVVGYQFEFSFAVLLGHAGHDRVVTADFGVVVDFVSLQSDVKVVSMLAADFGVRRINRAAEVGTVARCAIGFARKSRDFNTWSFDSFLRCHLAFNQTVLAVVKHQVGHVLVGNAAHGRVLSIAFFVSLQGRLDVIGALARNHRPL